MSSRPLMELDSSFPAPLIAESGRKQKELQILIVDDVPDNVESLAVLLELKGHQVHTALGGRTALEKAMDQPPDVVFLDLSMPGIDGYEVARRLRAMFLRKVVIVAHTAYGFEEVRLRCKEVGFDYHLVKPADIQEIEGLLQNCKRASNETSEGNRFDRKSSFHRSGIIQ
jgi:two-component system CheB/CheR fusion protein